MEKQETYFLDISSCGIEAYKISDIESNPEDFVFTGGDVHKLFRVESMTEVRVKSHTIIETVAPPRTTQATVKAKATKKRGHKSAKELEARAKKALYQKRWYEKNKVKNIGTPVTITKN